MRIAVNARLLVDQRLEGLGRYTFEVLCRLMDLLPEAVFVLICDREGELPALPRSYERINVMPQARHPLLFIAFFELSLPAALKRCGADVFLSCDNFCSLRSRVPTVLVVHDLAYRHVPQGVSKAVLAYYRYFMPRFVRRADAIITNSEFTRQDIAAAFGLSAADIDQGYSGVRPFFQPQPAEVRDAVRTKYSDGHPYFIAVGAIHPRKNIDGLIRGFDVLCDRLQASGSSQKPYLLLAGRLAWEAAAVEAALEVTRYRERIKILGFVEDEDLPRLIGAAEALCFVSHFEGFGVPIVEAYACEVPVIVSNRSSLPEIAGPKALLVEPERADQIADAMQRLLENPALGQVLAKAGRAHTRNYTWDFTADVVAKALVRVVNDKNS